MTDPTPSPTFNGVLHLEIRRKGPRPGVADIEHRVYSAKIARSAEDPEARNCTLEHVSYQGDSQQINRRELTLEGYDPETDTATYRESVKGSETWYEKLGRFGWVRRPDLEREEP
ncbi:hypothetical protein [Deinococcus sp. Leaf326]|uniref:hypothetical protein n=1 Tax=Deinococcus sp. Leaf326 TaxID=1736338 RepID=UPI0006F4770B|nr:hypothetical protein [Deinococcus sp. Leaf326]KQR02420.1 hypothetical protein ASF71_21485 [Deinococcus sp. Leaf326]